MMTPQQQFAEFQRKLAVDRKYDRQYTAPSEAAIKPSRYAKPRKPAKRKPSGKLADPIIQLKLERIADRILAKSGFFPKRENTPEAVQVEADCIGKNGLRPTWVGRP